MERLRIDKWLWAARFFKTRSLAVDDLHKGRIEVNGQTVKPSRELRLGEVVALRAAGLVRTVVVRGLSERRGSAPIAQQLYEETAESARLRADAAELRRMGAEPALTRTGGRPSRQQREELDGHTWDRRWSASHED